jgi:hypothetical protein
LIVAIIAPVAASKARRLMTIGRRFMRQPWGMDQARKAFSPAFLIVLHTRGVQPLPLRNFKPVYDTSGYKNVLTALSLPFFDTISCSFGVHATSNLASSE